MATGMAGMLKCNLSILLFVQLFLTVLQNTSVKGAVINNCINSTTSTKSCREITYEQVYNSLTKSENSFNIESALYPAKKSSSVQVFVNVYGPGNRTENPDPSAKYTWSISCLYAALPAKALQVWSLWSIFVTRRTQELNITISLFCCDVSQGKLKDHIEGVLAALQDLAVSPNIRDPQLNSAECITEGHEPNILATGHSCRIIAILCCSFIFAVFSGPLLAFYVLHLLENQSKPEKEKKAVMKTTDSLCGGLLVIFVLLFVCLLVTFICQGVQRYNYAFLYPDLGVAFVGFVVGCFTSLCCPDREDSPSKLNLKNIFYIMCANLTAYHFCWLLVGIMLNPTWGLAALLVVCLVIGVFSYAVFTFLCVRYSNPGYGKIPTGSGDNGKQAKQDDRIEHLEKDDGKHPNQAFFACLSAFLAVCCLIVVVILAGQSYHGRQTADEVLKDAVLYLISLCFSWLYWKSIASKPVSPMSQNTADNGSEQATPRSKNAGTELELKKIHKVGRGKGNQTADS